MSLHRRRSPPCASPVGGLTTAAASVIPQGVGAPPPPGLDPKKGKLMCIKVRMLDDTVGVFHLGHRALGQALFDEVCRHLNLLEGDYFGLEFYDCFGNRCWLDYQKPILRQITQTRSDARFYFVVKFYTPNPAELEEEYTRYLFALQIKRDLATGNLPCMNIVLFYNAREYLSQFRTPAGVINCNDNTAALMSSYIVQAECGDYVPEDYPDHTYLSVTKFVPNQDAEFEKRVFENHKKHVNTSPAEADMALLETARRCEMYGVKLHPAKDHEGVPINLSVLHSGVSVFQGLNCINKFSWAKIRKLSFKRKRFLIKLHPESFGFYKENVDFSFDNRNECKMFWKKCIEHHSFFRCSEVPRTPRQQFEFFSKGSSFRFSGRTQKQLIEYVREHHKRREPFQRPLLTMTPANALHRDYRTASAERTFPTPLLPIANSSSRLNGDIVSNGTMSPQTVANGDDGQSHPRAPHASSVNAPPGYDDESAIASGLRDGHAAIEEPGTPKLPRKILPVLQQQFHTYEPSSVQHAYNCAANTKGAVVTFHLPYEGELPPGLFVVSNELPEELRAKDRIVSDISADAMASSYRHNASHPYTSGSSSSISSSVASNATPSPPLQALPSKHVHVSAPLSGHLATHNDEQPEDTNQNSFGEPYPSHDGISAIPQLQEYSTGKREVMPTEEQQTASFSEMRGGNSNRDEEVTAGPGIDLIATVSSLIGAPVTASASECFGRSSVAPSTSQARPTSAYGAPIPNHSFTGPFVALTPRSSGSAIHQIKTFTSITAVTKPIAPLQTYKKQTPPPVAPKPAFLTAATKQAVPATCIDHKSEVPTCVSNPPAESSMQTTEEARVTSDAIQAASGPSFSAVCEPPIPDDSASKAHQAAQVEHKYLNGDIPYVLHMHYVENATVMPRAGNLQPADDYGASHKSLSTFKDYSVVRGRPATRGGQSTDGRKFINYRQKSLELVPKKRLPSPTNFSSQDHSVSPDTEKDVLFSYLRRKSANFASPEQGPPNLAASGADRSLSKRTDKRRQTQPILCTTAAEGQTYGTQMDASASEGKALRSRSAGRSQPNVATGESRTPDYDSEDEDAGSYEVTSLHDSMDVLESLDLIPAPGSINNNNNSHLDRLSSEQIQLPKSNNVSPPPSLCQSRRTEFTLEDSRRLARLHSVDSSSSGHATLAAGSSPLLCDDHSHANNALQRSRQVSNGSAAASPRQRVPQHSFTSPTRNGNADHRGSNGAVFPAELGSLRSPLSPSSNFGSEVAVSQLVKANQLTQSERILTAKSVSADGEDEAATALNRPSHHRSVPVLKQKASVRLSPSPTTSMKCSQTLAKLITDKTYFIVKELLMTERTYVREVNLISEHFRTAIANTFASMSLDQATQLMLEEFFASLEPIALAHNHFLANLEHRFAIWEQRILSSSSLQQLNHHGPLNIGDLFLGCVNTYLKVYQHYLAHLAIYLASLDELYRLNKTFMDVYKNFELQGICYLPVTALLMRPAYRLLHYQSILERLIEQHADQYGNQSAQRVIIINSKVSEEESAIFANFHECQMVLDRLVGLNLELKDSIRAMANFSKLSELERDLVAVDNLVQPRRVFIREGCLQRFSRKGPMQRMFFLFNDCLLYANRILGHALLRFRVNGQIPLRGLMLEDGDPFKVACDGAHCFTIYGANRSLIVSASSIEEKQAWVEDISKAVMCAKETAVDAFPRYSSLKSCGSIDEVDGYHTSLQSTSYDASGAKIESGSAGNLDVVCPSSSNAPHSPMSDRTFHYRANHSSHVCWHRQTTISARDLEISVETALSGYLLRKFRNSSGWQKLWVVFTHFCLFFYKSHLEDLPLASLPLLGYRVSPPESDDGLSKKDFTFKLYYRTHFYFFRAESQYAYERWLTALQSVVASSGAVLNDGALSLPEHLKEFTEDRIRETKYLLMLAS